MNPRSEVVTVVRLATTFAPEGRPDRLNSEWVARSSDPGPRIFKRQEHADRSLAVVLVQRASFQSGPRSISVRSYARMRSSIGASDGEMIRRTRFYAGCVVRA